MSKITDERLAEMVGAGVPCVQAQPGEIAAVVQELRRLRSQPAGVRVKGLEWADDGETAKARTSIGTYVIGKVQGKFGWVNSGLAGWNYASSFESAKAAAEADYRQRILSALEPQQEKAVAHRWPRVPSTDGNGCWHYRDGPPPEGSTREPLFDHHTPTQKEQESQRVSEDRIRGLEDVLAEKRECINNQRARIEALSAKLKEAEAALERISDVKYPDVDTIYAHRAMIDYARDQARLALHSIRED